jgi:hypothetical protein
MRFYSLVFYTIAFSQHKTLPYRDSTVVAASTLYKTRSITRRAFVGQNYRSTWALPVKMPVFDIRKENAGMVIVKLGGTQTKSLYMRDKDSINWVLRSVDKSFEKSMPGLVKKTFLKRYYQDMVSASYPYGALIAASLAKALGINAPQPTLFYVPDDDAFGEYRLVFAHTVCMLEKSEPSFDNTPTENTDTVLKRIGETKRYRVDDTSYLKVRLLDMLIADWDRHKDQLKWGVMKYDGDTVYYPIPRDRDQAFYYSNGLSLKFMHLFGIKYMAGFTNSTSKVRQLNYKSWELDRTLLKNLDEKDWRRIILAFQQTMNDNVLLSAINELPVEVRQKDAQMIFEKLKARRNNLAKDAMKYYAFIAKKN